MGTAEKISDLQKRREAIENGGDSVKKKKQKDENKLTARERVMTIFDDGSFIEIGAFAKNNYCEKGIPEIDAPCEGVVCGYGTVDGRLIYAYAQDQTVLGGAIGKVQSEKIVKIIDMAIKMGAPLVSLLDSNGARLYEGIEALGGLGDIIAKTSVASGVIPMICGVLGNVAGGESMLASLSDFVVMTEKTSQMFVTGPSVLSGISGKQVTKEDYATANVQAKNGNVHIVAQNDNDAIMNIRKLLSYLPSNNLEDTPYINNSDDINRLAQGVENYIIDDKTEFDMKQIITQIVDCGELFEIQKEFAQNMITSFARMNGSTVGIIANNSVCHDANIDNNACIKATRFIAFCDSYNIPLVVFTDVAGFAPCIIEEENGLIRNGAKLISAFTESTVPKINVVVRRAYGSAYLTMCSKQAGCDFVLAWPTATISVMEPEGAANMIYADKYAKCKNPNTAKEEIVEKYIEDYANPYIAAKCGFVDDIILPQETRPRVIAALEMLASKREQRPNKKHSNMSL